MSDRESLRGAMREREVVASISGGKDSAAMSLWLTEQGIEHRRVFADTGWEHPATYEYLRGPLAAKLGPIDEVRSSVGGMEEWAKKKGMFPSRMRRWCTEKLKVKPLAAYMSALDRPLVNAIGIRAAESDARSKQPEWEPADHVYGSDVLVWRPLLRWSEAEVIAMHLRHGLSPNPLYLRYGVERVGCWPCVFAKKKELLTIADNDPGRIELIRQLEAEVAKAAVARLAVKGHTLESRGFGAPTFFQKGGLGPAKVGEMVPIDEVVRWARTARGGRQFELFASQQEAGCVRWGLCDAAHDEEDAA